MVKPNHMNVQVFGHPIGRFLVKSKFNLIGTSRSLEDLEWTLKTFKFENPSVGIVGQNILSYFKKGKSIDFFKDKKLISKMLLFLHDRKNNRAKRSLTNLKLSMTSYLEENSSIVTNFKRNLKPRVSELMDDSFLCEKGDIPDKRLSLIESVLEYFLGYQQIFKFDVLIGFLSLTENDFQKFRENYVQQKAFLTGDQNLKSWKSIQRNNKEGKFSDLFDQEIINDVRKRVRIEEQEEFGRILKGLICR